MIWLPHKKYTSEHIADRLAETYIKMRRETRKMVFVATSAVSIMAAIQTAYIYGL